MVLRLRGGMALFESKFLSPGKYSVSSAKIFVKSSHGKTVEVDSPSGIFSKNTVELLMESVEKVTDVPVDNMRLIFAGKILERNEPLDRYGLYHECTVHLVE